MSNLDLQLGYYTLFSVDQDLPATHTRNYSKTTHMLRGLPMPTALPCTPARDLLGNSLPVVSEQFPSGYCLNFVRFQAPKSYADSIDISKKDAVSHRMHSCSASRSLQGCLPSCHRQFSLLLQMARNVEAALAFHC